MESMKTGDNPIRYSIRVYNLALEDLKEEKKAHMISEKRSREE